jgi:uncharacterized membrane protein YgaE (UPF0421/DUF939 family)
MTPKKSSGPVSFSRFTLRDAGFVKQALMTSAAATLALYLSRFMKLPEGYWAAVSAITAMQSDLGATIQVSINRLVGTAIGAIVGAAFLILLHMHLWSFAVALAAAILLCAVLNHWETYRFAGVTVAIVMLVPHAISPWLVGLHRFLEFSVGIVMALLVSTVVGDKKTRSLNSLPGQTH